MNFPIELIKEIMEYIPKVEELVKHEMETEGLPILNIDSRRQRMEHVYQETGVIFPVRLLTKKFKLTRMSQFENDYITDDTQYHVARMQEMVNTKIRLHMKIRSNLMKFHLSKV